MPFLLRRGPDYYSEEQIHCSPSSNSCGVIQLAAVVLHLRGDCIAKQPVQDRYGNILAWNGEIFYGLEVRFTIGFYRYSSQDTVVFKDFKCFVCQERTT